MEILAQIAEKAAGALAAEVSQLSHVREDLEWIQTQMIHIQSYLKEAEAKQVRTDFVRDIWDLAYDVEDILDTYFAKMRLRGSRWKRLLDLRNMRITHGFVKEVKRIRRRVEDLEKDRIAYGIDDSNSISEEDTWNPRKSYPHLDDPNVVGFDNLIETLVRKVLDEDLHHRVVSIIGFAGLGKTTLAKKVYNSARKSNSNGGRFDCTAWICVSESPNGKKLLQDIARNVGLDKEKIENDVEANLFAFLWTKRYVIVIDDIWHTTAWDALKIGLPMNSKNGSRIILTSRNRDVGVHVGGSNSIFLLEPLDQESSRILFNKLMVNDPQNICETKLHPKPENIGERILERCSGVPLAIVLVAGLLKIRERSESAWKGVLEGIGRDNDECAKIFALSYKDLPLNLKPCFLYFGIFPEDHEVEVFDLINLWAAEGFIRGSRMREVEEVGDDYLNHLLARNLIQVVERRYNGRVRSVKIHDIMHSICIQEAKDINFFNLHNNANFNSTVKVRRVTVHGSDVDHCSASYPNTSSLRGVFGFTDQNLRSIVDHKNSKYLRVLHVAGDDQMVDHKNSKYLRVLHAAYFGGAPAFALTNISHLSLLTYLKFESMCIELPYAISNLKNLLTLDLQECYEVYFPNVVWSMKQLRHILLPYGVESHAGCAPSDSRLSSCRVNLDVFHSRPDHEISLPNLQTLLWVRGDFFEANWLIKLTSLRRLGFQSSDEDTIRVLSDGAPVCPKLEELSLVRGYNLRGDTAISLNLSRYDNLSTLYFDLPGLNELSHDKLPPNLTELILDHMHLTMDPMEALKKLLKLKCLRLYNSAYLGKELVCSGEPGNFPQLEELVIHASYPLETLVIEEEGMPRLRKFIFYDNRKKVGVRVPDRVRNVMINGYI